MKVHGFVSKASQAGSHTLHELFARSHFLILPTRADCTPVVIPEACSFGLPVLTSDVGGIPTIVQNGTNGFAFPVDAGAETYCEAIETLWSSREAYVEASPFFICRLFRTT